MQTVESIAQSTLHVARRLLASPRRLGRPAAVAGALLLAASTATVWGTANTAPQFTSLTASATVVQVGQTLTLTGTFADPDVNDLHTLRIHWASSETGKAESVQLPAGQHAFQLTHTYTEVYPPTTIAVSLYDRQTPPGSNDNSEGAGKDYRTLPIRVVEANVAPSFVESSINIQLVQHTGGVLAEVDGEWTDPDPEDGWVTIRSGVGPPSQTVSPCETMGRRFCCVRELGYSSSRQYAIELKVVDGHRGLDTYRTTVRVP